MTTLFTNPFLRACLLAAILIVLWLLTPLQPLWQTMDRIFFIFLNHTFVYFCFGPKFWALANHRLIDVPMFLILFSIPLYAILQLPESRERQKQLAHFLFALCYLVIMIFITRNLLRLGFNYFAWHRISPSLIFADSLRLSTYFPQLHIKDASSDCFPGDHTTVLLVWLGFLIGYTNKKYIWIGLSVVLFFSLPRLIAGAHWLSDLLVGSSMMALLILGLAYTGTLQQKSIGFIEQGLAYPWARRLFSWIY